MVPPSIPCGPECRLHDARNVLALICGSATITAAGPLAGRSLPLRRRSARYGATARRQCSQRHLPSP
jgi:hypothetical protein